MVHISCGDFHTLAVDDTGRVYAWGSALYGRLGVDPREADLQVIAR